MGVRRKIKISVLILAALLALFISVINSEKEDKKEPDLIFADNYISYVLNNETVSINIFGAKRSTSNFSKITGVKLNNENIEIDGFEIDLGMTDHEYQLFNIMLDIRVSGTGIEKADTIAINFNNNDSQKYKVGQIIVVNETKTSQHISYWNNYTVGYPKPSLNTSITNKSDKSIILESVSDLNEVLTYDFLNKIVIEPGKSSKIDIPSFNSKHSDQDDFYTITPIIHYNSDGKKYTFDLPTVIYGLLDDDDIKLSKIIK